MAGRALPTLRRWERFGRRRNPGDGFPAYNYSYEWWAVDLLAQVSTGTPVPISPTTATFVNGVWTGNVTVQQTATAMYLSATDGSGDVGNSNTFNVLIPLLTPTIPASATVGQGVVNGTDHHPGGIAERSGGQRHVRATRAE